MQLAVSRRGDFSDVPATIRFYPRDVVLSIQQGKRANGKLDSSPQPHYLLTTNMGMTRKITKIAAKTKSVRIILNRSTISVPSAKSLIFLYILNPLAFLSCPDGGSFLNHRHLYFLSKGLLLLFSQLWTIAFLVTSGFCLGRVK